VNSKASDEDFLNKLVDELDLSTRSYNCLQDAEIYYIGQLVQKSETELLHLRNFGPKCLVEINELLQAMNLTLGMRVEGYRFEPPPPRPFYSPRTFYPPPFRHSPLTPDFISISPSAGDWLLEQLPFSVRLGGVLERLGVRRLGDLRSFTLNDVKFTKNCGAATLAELELFIAKVQAGEFDMAASDVSPPGLLQLLLGIDNLLTSLSDRDYQILLLRYGANDGAPKTLEEVGSNYSLTRERVRQLVDKTLKRWGVQLALRFHSVLNGLAERCHFLVCPLTPSLLTFWLPPQADTLRLSIPVYLRLMDELFSEIPVWAEGQKTGVIAEKAAMILYTVRQCIKDNAALESLKSVFEKVQSRFLPEELTVLEFLDALSRSQMMRVEFPAPDAPVISPPTLKTRQWSRIVLSQSDHPLTTQEIFARAKTIEGMDLFLTSARAVEHALTPEYGFYRLAGGTFGLRHHFRLPENLWQQVKEDIYQLFVKEQRPISTFEIINEQDFSWIDLTNAYEIAQILREDERFFDLHRLLFALSAWGIEERDYIRDLIPKVLGEAGQPMKVSAIIKAIRQYRSVTPTSLKVVLRKSDNLYCYGCGFYGLKSWGEGAKQYLLTNRTIVNHTIAHADHLLTFEQLCQSLEIPPQGALADQLWQTVLQLRKVRTKPTKQSPDTILFHAHWTLERALQTILQEASRPLRIDELRAELNERFASVFAHKSAVELEKCLQRSALFVCHADDGYSLDSEVISYDLETSDIRQLCFEFLSVDETISCEDLLELIEEEGVEVENLSPETLASLLRDNDSVEEVGNHRFRAKVRNENLD